MFQVNKEKERAFRSNSRGTEGQVRCPTKWDNEPVPETLKPTELDDVF